MAHTPGRGPGPCTTASTVGTRPHLPRRRDSFVDRTRRIENADMPRYGYAQVVAGSRRASVGRVGAGCSTLFHEPSGWSAATRKLEVIQRSEWIVFDGSDLVGVDIAAAGQAAESRPVRDGNGRCLMRRAQDNRAEPGPAPGLERANRAAAEEATKVNPKHDNRIATTGLAGPGRGGGR
jgi:hypothetical protein